MNANVCLMNEFTYLCITLCYYFNEEKYEYVTVTSLGPNAKLHKLTLSGELSQCSML